MGIANLLIYIFNLFVLLRAMNILTNLGGGKTLFTQLHDVFFHIFRGDFKPRGDATSVR